MTIRHLHDILIATDGVQPATSEDVRTSEQVAKDLININNSKLKENHGNNKNRSKRIRAKRIGQNLWWFF